MSNLRKAAEMVVEVFDNDYGDIAKKIAIHELRKALNEKLPVKSYCGGKPNYCDEPEKWMKEEK